MSEQQTGLIQRASIPALVAAWHQSVGEVEAAAALIVQAEDRLKLVFGAEQYGFEVMRYHERDFRPRDMKPLIKRLSLDAWRVLIQRLELRRIMSTKRAKEMDEQLNRGDMPEITEENLTGILMSMLERTPEFMEEAVRETIEWLMPNRQTYVSTSPFVIGPKVVLTWCVERGWGNSHGFRTSNGREQQLRGLDNTFHLLDGKGTVPTNRGPLVDAINATTSDGRFETTYFKGRAFINRNLHLTFKRPDLVDELNKLAAGNKLRNPAAKGGGR